MVDVRGEVDFSTCVLLRERLLLALTGRDRRSMVVNLAGVSFLDSAGIGVLVEVWHRVQAGPGILALAAPSPQARAVFDTTGLGKVFSIYDTEAQAVQFVGSGTFPSSASGQYLLQGSGALAGLHAEGPFSGSFQTVTYGGQLLFS